MIDKPSLWNHKNSPDPCLLVEELTNVVGDNDVHDVDVVINPRVSNCSFDLVKFRLLIPASKAGDINIHDDSNVINVNV